MEAVMMGVGWESSRFRNMEIVVVLCAVIRMAQSAIARKMPIAILKEAVGSR
jgi:hypothetical protein